MRWIIIGLGIITVLLAVVLARESQWWLAIPDGLFGLGVAWVAWADLHAEHRPAPAERATEPPAAIPAVELRAEPAPVPAPQPAPAASAPAAPSRSSPPPARHRGKHRKRHRH